MSRRVPCGCLPQGRQLSDQRLDQGRNPSHQLMFQTLAICMPLRRPCVSIEHRIAACCCGRFLCRLIAKQAVAVDLPGFAAECSNVLPPYMAMTPPSTRYAPVPRRPAPLQMASADDHEVALAWRIRPLRLRGMRARSAASRLERLSHTVHNLPLQQNFLADPDGVVVELNLRRAGRGV